MLFLSIELFIVCFLRSSLYYPFPFYSFVGGVIEYLYIFSYVGNKFNSDYFGVSKGSTKMLELFIFSWFSPERNYIIDQDNFIMSTPNMNTMDKHGCICQGKNL